MNIKTIIKIYDVLINDGYKAQILVVLNKGYAWIELTFKKGSYKETLFSDIYSEKYVLRKLEGITFKSKIYE